MRNVAVEKRILYPNACALNFKHVHKNKLVCAYNTTYTDVCQRIRKVRDVFLTYLQRLRADAKRCVV